MPHGAAASHTVARFQSQQHNNDTNVVQSTSNSSHSSDSSPLLRAHHLSPPTDVQSHAPLLDSLLRLPIMQQPSSSVEPFSAQQAPPAHMALLQALLHNNNGTNTFKRSFNKLTLPYSTTAQLLHLLALDQLKRLRSVSHAHQSRHHRPQRRQ